MKQDNNGENKKAFTRQKPLDATERSDGVVFNYSGEQKDAIFNAICNRVVIDRISFNQAVKESEICLSTFYDWLLETEKRKETYNYAREIRCDTLFEDIVEIADNKEEGETIIEKPDGVQVKRGDMIEHRRLRVDARKWVVSKMNPKKYGDKLDVTTDNKSLNQPAQIAVNLGSGVVDLSLRPRMEKDADK